MMKRYGHYFIFGTGLLAFIEKIIYMGKISSWTGGVEDLIWAVLFIGGNSACFLPFLLFARKSYEKTYLFIVDLVFLGGMVFISIQTDWSIETSTDGQAGLVYIAAPVIQWGLVTVPIVIHCISAVMSRKTGGQSLDNSAL